MLIFYLISSFLSFNIQIDEEMLRERTRSVPYQEALPKVVRFIALDGDISKIDIEIETERIERRTFLLTPSPRPLRFPTHQPTNQPTNLPTNQLTYRQVSFGGYPLLYISILPVYDTLLIRNVRIEIETQKGDYRYNSVLTQSVRNIVINPEDVRESKAEDGKFLLITESAFLSGFAPLLDWKIRRGTEAMGVSIEWILANFPAADSAHSIRDYITYAWLNLGISWVLLGGDVDIIPVKRQFARVGGWTDSIASDLFYSDLSSPWDSSDMLPEVVVGRAPVNTLDEVDTFVEKTLRYEKEPDSTYIETAFFLGFPADAYTDFLILKQYIANNFLPGYDVIYGTGGVLNTLSGLNQGRHLVNHAGHGYYAKLEVGGELLLSSHVDGLINRERPFLFYTISCYSGGFHVDCIGESFLLNPDGGAYAFIGNTSYGWFESGNPFLYSAQFDTLFFKILISPEMFGITRRLGEVFVRSKTPFISFDDDPYRWSQFSLNLLADPEVPIFQRDPLTPEVTYPSFLPIATCTVRVHVQRNGINYFGATVCLWKEGDFYLVQHTNTYGFADFILSPSLHGICHVTVTGPGISPYEGVIFIGDSLFPDFYVDRYLIRNDPSRDMRLDPGETADLVTIVGNLGERDGDGVSARISTDEMYITIIDSQAYLGKIKIGDEREGIFIVQAAEETPIEYEATLNLHLETDRGYREKVPFKIKIGRVAHPYGTHSVGNFYFSLSDDGSYGFTSPFSGDGIGFIYPKGGSNILSYGTLLFGNSVQYLCDNSLDSDFVRESGLYIGDRIFSGQDGWTRFTDSGSPNPRGVEFTQHSWVFSGSLDDDFVIIKVDVLPSNPIDSVYIGAWLDFDVGSAEMAGIVGDIGYIYKDSLYAAIVPLSGALKNLSVIDNTVFIHPDGGLSDYNAYRFLKGDLSFDDGDIPGDYSFVMSFGPYLLLEEKVIAYAIMGGLSMDDIIESVSRARAIYKIVGIEENENYELRIMDYGLKVYPNPFREKTVISYRLSVIGNQPITISIYDLAGRLIRTLPITDHRLPITEVTWDGKDEDGRKLASGIYFARVEAGDYRETKKMILLR